MAKKPTMRPAMASGGSGNTMLMAKKPTTRTAMASGGSGNTIPTVTKPTMRPAKAIKKAHLGACYGVVATAEAAFAGKVIEVDGKKYKLTEL